MLQLLNLEKNSLLSIYVNNRVIHANLTYVDYVSGRTYTLSDLTELNDDFEQCENGGFWIEYFAQLSMRFNWNFFRGRELMNVAAEGVGISGINIYINSGTSSSKIVGALREISHDFNFKNISDDYFKTILSGLSFKSGYQDIIYLNLDLYDFEVSRYVRDRESIKLSVPNVTTGNFKQYGIHWQNVENLTDSIDSSKLQAFFSLEAPAEKRTDLWANYVNKPVLQSSSPIIKDILRSFISVQLISIVNDAKGRLDNIGMSADNTLIIVGGTLVKSVEIKHFLVSILDGLEIRGSVDIALDYNQRFVGHSDNFIFDEKSKLPLLATDILTNLYRCVIIEGTPAIGGRKVVFNGKLESINEGERDIFAITPEFSMFNIGEGKAFITGECVQGAYWGDKERKFELYSDTKGLAYKGLVLDARIKPVVYGPDERTNRIKLNSWINEAN